MVLPSSQGLGAATAEVSAIKALIQSPQE